MKKVTAGHDALGDFAPQLAFYAGWPKAWAAFRMAKEVYTD